MSQTATPPLPSPSALPPIPSSPTYTYASTAGNPLGSTYSLPLPPPPPPSHAILTKSDLEHSSTAYADLLSTAKTYRLALASLSSAASAFGSALEACARLKEARAETLGSSGLPSTADLMGRSVVMGREGSCTSTTLLSTAGLQHLIANHQQILSETVYRSFEVPLLHELDKWMETITDEQTSYNNKIKAQSQEIRKLEKEGAKLSKMRKRDVTGMRRHLVELTAKLDGLTGLSTEHARVLLRESQELSCRVGEASCSLVRAEVDIFEGLARKGWVGGGLEDVLERGRDVLGESGEGTGREEGEGDGEGLFSILPPGKSILSDTGIPDTADEAGLEQGKERPGPGMQTRSDTVLLHGEGDLSTRYQSITGVIGHDRGESESIFSEFNRPRLGGVRPFSPQPQPLSMNPDGLILGGFGEEDQGDSESGSESSTMKGGDKDELDLHAEHVDPWRNEGLRDNNAGNSVEDRQRDGERHTRSGSPTDQREEDDLDLLTETTPLVRRRWSGIVVEDPPQSS
jgi:hypothetical protein